MKKIIFTIFLILSISNNTFAKNNLNFFMKNSLGDTSEINLKKFNEGVDFYATGNEPFWNLEIMKDKYLKFSILNGLSLTLGSVKIDKAMDANVMRYFSKTESGNFTATLYGGECTENMSGEKSNYKVIVEINNSGDKNYQKFEGCGRYVPDYNLNRKWTLFQISKTSLIDASDYPRGFPEITFDIENESYSGNAGCNSFNGTVFSEKDRLKFYPSGTTMMQCSEIDKEIYFLELMNKTTNYRITKSNQLFLSNPDSILMVFYDPENIMVLLNDNVQDVGVDYRLNDIWVLENINGTEVDIKNHLNGLPRLEIKISEMTFMGYGGCNNISGKLQVVNNKIKFSDIGSTRMMCPGNFEKDFLDALKSAENWKIENMRLYLFEGEKNVLVMRKID